MSANDLKSYISVVWNSIIMKIIDVDFMMIRQWFEWYLVVKHIDSEWLSLVYKFKINLFGWFLS
jgi:hypothetical protein